MRPRRECASFVRIYAHSDQNMLALRARMTFFASLRRVLRTSEGQYMVTFPVFQLAGIVLIAKSLTVLHRRSRIGGVRALFTLFGLRVTQGSVHPFMLSRPWEASRVKRMSTLDSHDMERCPFRL